jgi:hypothetical protein
VMQGFSIAPHNLITTLASAEVVRWQASFKETQGGWQTCKTTESSAMGNFRVLVFFLFEHQSSSVGLVVTASSERWLRLSRKCKTR